MWCPKCRYGSSSCIMKKCPQCGQSEDGFFLDSPFQKEGSKTLGKQEKSPSENHIYVERERDEE